MKKVEIYTTQWCPYCHAAKSLLDEKGVSYEEVDADDPDVRLAMVQRANGRRTVPQIFVGETHVGGYDDMAALDRRGQLDPLLAN
ncbi:MULTISPECIES: glutaredoxin 3 [unclassified Devosia]|jgi:glutaredoxin 3|uniref:glutaredoxin 3 n=1 Tax=unclassified Devosia TaxID=196773 RepID=UPI00086AF59C|nr:MULTISPECIES: glutaredoxin 3 [unclassified Devosia]MBN9364983.1 glutaredoxin 3 [Devosia sp.]ODS95584.1 MAG: glutaredoxin 3 [Devosia sp. SCN 66-27]OJX21170.1 MAG: glutaredoxin 3 [Devosia sp. 66-14]